MDKVELVWSPVGIVSQHVVGSLLHWGRNESQRTLGSFPVRRSWGSNIYFLAMPVAYGSSRARDGTLVKAVTQATAVTVSDP